MAVKVPTTQNEFRITRRKLLVAGAAIGASARVLAAPFSFLAGSAAFPAFSQQADEATLLAGAKKEGRGVFYTTAPLEETQRVTNPFKAKYGIEIEIVRLTSGELEQRFAAELTTKNFVADAFYTSNILFITDAQKKGWFTKVGDLPASKGWPSFGWDGSSALVSRTPYSIAWNSNLVPQGIKSWEELADPRWKVTGPHRVVQLQC